MRHMQGRSRRRRIGDHLLQRTQRASRLDVTGTAQMHMGENTVARRGLKGFPDLFPARRRGVRETESDTDASLV